MNLIVLVGNIGADATVTKINDDYSVINFSIAVQKNIKNEEKKTTWWKCSWFIKNPKIAEYLIKGSVVTVVGEAELEKYVSSADQTEKVNLKCSVSDVKLCYTPNRQE